MLHSVSGSLVLGMKMSPFHSLRLLIQSQLLWLVSIMRCCWKQS